MINFAVVHTKILVQHPGKVLGGDGDLPLSMCIPDRQDIVPQVPVAVRCPEIDNPVGAEGTGRIGHQGLAQRLKVLEKELNKKMRMCAAELNFEEAAVLRDRLVDIRKLIYDSDPSQA